MDDGRRAAFSCIGDSLQLSNRIWYRMVRSHCVHTPTGTETYVRVDFGTTVGFMSPDPDAMVNPSYRQVCSGSTGHVEVLYVELNKPDEDFEHIIRFFFQFHDPITKNRQGNDAGTQYAPGCPVETANPPCQRKSCWFPPWVPAPIASVYHWRRLLPCGCWRGWL
jgi:hypothetical protein